LTRYAAKVRGRPWPSRRELEQERRDMAMLNRYRKEYRREITAKGFK
jgi:hypothetical protein